MSGSLSGSVVRDCAVRVVRAPIRRDLPPDREPGPWDALRLVVLRLRDRDGVEGWSFVFGLDDRATRLQIEACRAFAATVVGRPVSERAAVSAAIDDGTWFFGPGLLHMGAAAQRMALTDLACRRLGVSLSTLLGRVRTAVPAYLTGLSTELGPDEAAAVAAGLHERGFRAVKAAIGTRPVDEEVERIRRLRGALPPDMSLMVDALQRWSVPDAVRACDRLADCGLTWLEDPIVQSDHRGYERLCRRSPVPIATGENEVLVRDLVELADAGVAYVIADLMRVGGFERWLEVGARLAGGPAVLVPHLFPHVSLQLVATLRQRVVWTEWVPWFDDLVRDPIEVENGLIRVPDVVGSGFAPHPDGLDRNALSDWIPLP